MSSEERATTGKTWYIVALGLTLIGVLALWIGDSLARLVFTPAWLIWIWAMTWLSSRRRNKPQAPGVGGLFGILIVSSILMLLGVMAFQPARANPPDLGYVFHLLALVWLVSFQIQADDPDTLRDMGRKLSSSRWDGLFTALVTLIFLFFVVEFGLRFFAMQSFGTNSILTLNYTNATWGETNSLGFRDDYEPTAPTDGTPILVVGDSVAAGFAITDRDDRFANRLDEKLGATHTVYVAAESGWGTQEMLEALETYPLTPELVVVSYFVNDVEDAYEAIHPIETNDSWVLNPFLNGIFIVNFLHWNVFFDWGALPDVAVLAGEDPEVLALHSRELLDVIELARSRDIDIAFIVWSHPVAMEAHQGLLDTVRGLLDREGVPYVDMEPIMRPYPVGERVATVYDAHPNVAMHTLAAEALYDTLTTAGLVQPVPTSE